MVEKTTYCFECVWWKPQRSLDRHPLYGRCGDLKQRTLRLDHCDTDKIPSKPSGGERT